MPGPVSDSYDPEFGTVDNAEQVAELLREAVAVVSESIDGPPKDIVQVAQGASGRTRTVRISERHLRAIRYAINWRLEDI